MKLKQPLERAVIVGLETVVNLLAPTEADRFFETRVRPVLVEHCVRCHGPKKQEAGLWLDSRAAVLKGGDSGPAALSGKPKESRLVRAVHRSVRRIFRAVRQESARLEVRSCSLSVGGGRTGGISRRTRRLVFRNCGGRPEMNLITIS